MNRRSCLFPREVAVSEMLRELETATAGREREW